MSVMQGIGYILLFMIKKFYQLNMPYG